MKSLLLILIGLISFSSFAYTEEATSNLINGNYGTQANYCGFRIIPGDETLTAVAINNPYSNIRCSDAGQAFRFEKANIRLSDGRVIYAHRKLCSNSVNWCMAIEILDEQTFIMHVSSSSHAFFLN